MMEDDLITGLTRQVKEEVIEHYLTERRLLDFQIEEVHSLAEETRMQAQKTGRRLTRLGFLAIQSEMREKLGKLLNIPPESFWRECMDKQFARGVRLIRVRGFTDKAKFKKLFLEAYARFYKWMKIYEKSYRSLQAECEAVNDNIKNFHRNFDLLAIINFLKSLDVITLERKQYLGENFSAEELSSIDQKLHIPTISFEKLHVPQPISLPKPEMIEDRLSDLSVEVYRKFQTSIKRMMR